MRVKHVRVLILDDASPDNTSEVGAELAREDSRVTQVRHHVNKGHIATYNEGIDWVSARITCCFFPRPAQRLLMLLGVARFGSKIT